MWVVLDSNPEATVTWRNPSGVAISNSGRFKFIKNSAGDVRLEFTTLLMDDMGVWNCIVTVQGTDVTLSTGGIDDSLVGSTSFDIMIHCSRYA